jgi:hypothetical protein
MFELNSDFTILISKSKAVIRINFEKNIFKSYVDENIKKLPEHDPNFDDIIDVTEHGISLPNGLLHTLVTESAKHAAADPALKNEAPTSNQNNEPAKPKP